MYKTCSLIAEPLEALNRHMHHCLFQRSHRLSLSMPMSPSPIFPVIMTCSFLLYILTRGPESVVELANFGKFEHAGLQEVTLIDLRVTILPTQVMNGNAI